MYILTKPWLQVYNVNCQLKHFYILAIHNYQTDNDIGSVSNIFVLSYCYQKEV